MPAMLRCARLAGCPAVRRSASSLSSADRHLLHRSPVPTDFFQRSLPHLKVPELPETIERYLKSQRPLLSDAQFADTERISRAFLTGQGPELQKRLVEYDKADKSGNFVSEFWYDMYLRDRRHLVLNHTPFIACHPNDQDVLVRLTNMLYSSARFYLTYTQDLLKPEVFFLDAKLNEDDFYRKMRLLSRMPGHRRFAWFAAYFMKAFPLDMVQYSSLMGSTRIPQLAKDALRRWDDSTHIVVMRRGRAYRLELLDESGGIRAPESIFAGLAAIVADPTPPEESPVGVLTTADRDEWARSRARMEGTSEVNRRSLEAIDSALFVLCLDEGKFESDAALCKNFLHSTELGNRWWDKSFSLVSAVNNGEVAINFEHSWGDGVAVLRYFNEIFKDSGERPALQSAPASPPSHSLTCLNFELDEATKQDIQRATAQLAAKCDDLELDFHLFEEVGRDDARRAGLSPDAVAQLAIQLAYYRVSGGKTASSYESCSTAAFKRGRTETIRPTTVSTQTFCRLAETDASVQQLAAALRACSSAHSQLTKEAAMGKGWDRHLYALKRIADRDGLPGDIFDDPAYASINRIVLSTSTLMSPAVKIGGFAPVVNDGYGIGYAIFDLGMGCVTTAYKSSGVDAPEFVRAYGEACKSIAVALNQCAKERKQK